MSSLTDNHLLSVFGFSKDDIFVGGAEGTMLHFNGEKWESMDLNGRWAIKIIWVATSDNLFAVATDGRILHYDGKSWSVDETETLPPMTGVFGLSEKAKAKLEIFNILGESVQVVVNDRMDAGFYDYNISMHGLASGLYFYLLTAIGENGQQLSN